MVPMEEAVRSIFGAYRLARLDARGLTLFNDTAEGAANSFWAAALLLPFYAILLAIDWAGEDVVFGRLLLIESLAYVIAWTAFPVLMIPISRAMGRFDRFFGFLAVYNWAQVIQMVVVIPPVLLVYSRLLPNGMGETLLFIVQILLLIYEGYIIRLALSIGGLEAAGLVLFDLMIGVTLRVTVYDMVIGG